MAKQGYVNLLQSQKSSKKRHGDDTLMVKARQDFLDKGYYTNLRDAIIDAVVRNTPDENAVIADLGCGECWYTERIYNALNNPTVFGIDISKQALIAGSKRCRDLKLAVASTADIPLSDESCDAVVCVFAPYTETEVLRILKRGGVFIQVPIGKCLMLSPTFPPASTVRATFTAHGAPSLLGKLSSALSYDFVIRTHLVVKISITRFLVKRCV